MSSVRANSVDIAIALFLELGRRGGWRSLAELSDMLAVPRSSLRRIAGLLESEGLLERRRGEVAAAFGLRFPAPPRVGITSCATRDIDGPLILSPPLESRGKRSYRIGMANAAMDNPWRHALVHSVEYAASKLHSEISRFIVRHADNDPNLQALQIDELIELGVDGLIVSAVASPKVKAAIDRATHSGICVVLVDRGLDGTTCQQSFVTADNAQIGATTALWLAETLGGKGVILTFPGLASAAPAHERHESACVVFAQFPELRIDGPHWTEWHPERAQRVVENRISRGDRIDGIWCDSGLQSVGSLSAFAKAGFRPGAIPPHTGGDLNGAFKLALRLKVRLAAVDYPPSMGIAAMETLIARLRGRWVPQTTVIASDVVITKGDDTASIRATHWVEDHVRFDLPDALILSAGLGPAYNPRAFRTRYPGNRYNRSAAGSAK